jgi:hypothetical protein
VLTAVKNNFAQPLISMVSAPLTSAFTEKLRFDFENVLSGGQARKDSDAARDLERKQQLERVKAAMEQTARERQQLVMSIEGSNDNAIFPGLYAKKIIEDNISTITKNTVKPFKTGLLDFCKYINLYSLIQKRIK